MLKKQFSRLTILMIYIGTLLLSILSFFTTYAGMTILLNENLALIGSLGLQIAMLGIAWNLMKIKEKRIAYISVFCLAASFSIFFSYANFDTNLKENTRIDSARKNYTNAARNVLADYSKTARDAALKGRYQIDRLNTLMTLEKTKGWATAVDEGSGDPFIQNFLDGARATVASWERLNSKKYSQGIGEGIIYNYFTGKITQVETNMILVNNYITKLNNTSQKLNSTLTVEDQSKIVNDVWAKFPISEIALMTATVPVYSNPPNRADFVETPKTRQQAFMMVINDFAEMDRLATFSLLLAFAIDFIVILMAFVGSYRVDEIDFLFDRVRVDTVNRLKKLSLDNSSSIDEVTDESLHKIQKASDFGINMIKSQRDYDNRKKQIKIVLKRKGEEAIREDLRQENMDEISQKRFTPEQHTATISRMRTLMESKEEETISL